MSVSTWVHLSPGVRIRDVADAIAILLGKKKELKQLPQSKADYVEVEGVSFDSSGAGPECCVINIKDIPKEYGNGWWFHYHFESENGTKALGGGSRAVRIALHKRLVDLFGGWVDYNDGDLRARNYSKKAPRWVGKEHDGAFNAKQKALWDLKPLTQEEIKKYEKYAAYKENNGD